jgi:hypothetical protein
VIVIRLAGSNVVTNASFTIKGIGEFDGEHASEECRIGLA